MNHRLRSWPAFLALACGLVAATALLTRLTRICRRRIGSPLTEPGTLASTFILSSRSLRSAAFCIRKGRAPVVAAIGAGALLYTSVNSLGWSLARPDRRPYAMPMLAGAAIGLVAAVWLVVTTP